MHPFQISHSHATFSPCALARSLALSDRPDLLDRDGVRAGGEDSIGTSEGLGTGLQLGDVLGVGDALIVDEVGEELHQVAAERLDLAGGDERVDGRVAVGARVQGPRAAGNGGGGDGGAGGGDGAGTAQGGEPDHDLVLVGAVGGGGQPQVVGHIGDDVRASVAINGRRSVLDIIFGLNRGRGVGKGNLTSSPRWRGSS